MYTVNLGENRLVALERASFSELRLGERRHLQEWLANEPNALGEDLLMIQKEFDGFDETRERLDRHCHVNLAGRTKRLCVLIRRSQLRANLRKLRS